MKESKDLLGIGDLINIPLRKIDVIDSDPTSKPY